MSTSWDGTGQTQEDFMKKDEVIIVSEDDRVTNKIPSLLCYLILFTFSHNLLLIIIFVYYFRS